MKLDPEQQQLLLELATAQRIQATGTQPPEPEEKIALQTATAELEKYRAAAASAQLAVDDMELEILRIQADETKLRRRSADDKKQLTAATDPEKRKDLEKDLYTTKSRIGDLLSELAEAHNEIHALRNNADLNNQRVKEAEQKVAAAQAVLDANPPVDPVVEQQQRIAYLRETLPANIIAEYDAQRQENSVGVASFNGRSCGGCFMVLPPNDITAIRTAAPDEVPQCPDCGSYLVRA
ncbi:MAG: C4-type zinc ribbon domain-containing protein [Corynebacterium sp.]|nr:C4-type zinc ribbon domain-containing protein [Corynebacterium sp.]